MAVSIAGVLPTPHKAAGEEALRAPSFLADTAQWLQSSSFCRIAAFLVISALDGNQNLLRIAAHRSRPPTFATDESVPLVERAERKEFPRRKRHLWNAC